MLVCLRFSFTILKLMSSTTAAAACTFCFVFHFFACRFDLNGSIFKQTTATNSLATMWRQRREEWTRKVQGMTLNMARKWQMTLHFYTWTVKTFFLLNDEENLLIAWAMRICSTLHVLFFCRAVVNFYFAKCQHVFHVKPKAIKIILRSQSSA